MDARGVSERPAKPRLSYVVAVSRNGVIGNENALPWRLPDDLRQFKALTLGKPVLMGRKTFQSIGKPLPGRTNIVLTRDTEWRADGVAVAHTLEDAFAAAGPVAEIMVIGGAEIYRLLMPSVERLYLTRVDADLEGDTHFPSFDERAWRVSAEVLHPADEKHAHAFRFLTLDRR